MNFRTLLMGAAVTAAALSFAAAANAADAHEATAHTDGDATVIRPITITGGATLSFGRIVKPTTGGGTVTIDTASTAGITPTGGIVLLGSFTRPSYTIGGEGGLTYNLTVPATFDLTGPNSSKLTVALTPNIGGSDTATGSTHTLAGAAGSAATDDTLVIGAAVPIDHNTPTGAYAGGYDVTVTYN